MPRHVSRLVALLIATVVLFSVPAQRAYSGGWADALFGTTSHDFGPVPRGAKVRHNFLLTNRLSEPITIINVRASCGCTTGRATSEPIAPGKAAVVEAEMDTRNFVGKKATVLYVTLITGAGKEAEVRLNVVSHILSDIVLNPGTVDFGVIAHGQTPSQSLTIDRVGMPTWQVKRMVSSCKAIDATLSETARQGESVGYLLRVTVKPDAAPGAIRDEIKLMTNDPETPVFPIQVTMTVKGDLTASPSNLYLGNAASSAEVQGRFLVRSSRPFTIRAIEGDNEGFKATVDTHEPKPVHIVTITFRPEETTPKGDLRHTFRVHTDLSGEQPLELTATARLNPIGPNQAVSGTGQTVRLP